MYILLPKKKTVVEVYIYEQRYVTPLTKSSNWVTIVNVQRNYLHEDETWWEREKLVKWHVWTWTAKSFLTSKILSVEIPFATSSSSQQHYQLERIIFIGFKTINSHFSNLEGHLGFVWCFHTNLNDSGQNCTTTQFLFNKRKEQRKPKLNCHSAWRNQIEF